MRPLRPTSTFMLLTGSIALAACGAQDTDTEDIGSDDAEVTGAVYTTFDEEQGGCLQGNGNGINCNHYASKPDVYMSGGPVAGGLGDGDYYFTVLVPGSQNGGFIDGAGGNLSDDYDSAANRSFRVEDHQIVTNYGTHAEGETPNGKVAIQLWPYADTTNNGGVYILAVCLVGATSPSQCKYDAFKVDGEPVCGDGVVDDDETCDDGNAIDDDECMNDCSEPITPPPPSFCGDGVIDADEACDDGNAIDDDECMNDCSVPIAPPGCCGDGVLNAGEQCDDGNTLDGDACMHDCTTTVPA